MNKMRERYKEIGTTLQPLIIVVGINLSSVASFYVCYDNLFYKLPTFLKAIDICFKLFHVMNFKYPVPSKQIWTFVQNYIYNIYLKEDEKSSGLSLLLRKFEEIKESSEQLNL